MDEEATPMAKITSEGIKSDRIGDCIPIISDVMNVRGEKAVDDGRETHGLLHAFVSGLSGPAHAGHRDNGTSEGWTKIDDVRGETERSVSFR